jgi:acetyltransferase-like isoleucine patch superfamily enzyme
MRALLGELTGRALDPSVRVLPPFHTDSGRNLRFGRTCSSTHGCTAMDLGGHRHRRRRDDRARTCS